MLIPPFWRGRVQNAPARDRLARLRAVIQAANSWDAYRLRLAPCLLTESLNFGTSVESIQAVEPWTFQQYEQCFPQRARAFRRSPENQESRSAVLVPFRQARAGFDHCLLPTAGDADPYSPEFLSMATADLFHLAVALNDQSTVNSEDDFAIAMFSGNDAGLISPTQRDRLWDTYQVPIFEQFLGTDGCVVAAECEVHDGLHIREEHAIVESLDGELVLTSLTDLLHPAIRVRTGIYASIRTEPCDCGRTEPRIT